MDSSSRGLRGWLELGVKEIWALLPARPRLWLAFLRLGCHGSQGPSSQILREVEVG